MADDEEPVEGEQPRAEKPGPQAPVQQGVAAEPPPAKTSPGTQLSRTIMWQNAQDVRAATTMDREKYDDWSDNRDGWRALVGKGSADVSLVDLELKHQSWMWKLLTEIEAVSVSEGKTRPGQTFREFWNYVNIQCVGTRRAVSMLAFVRMKQEELGLGHSRDPKNARPQPRLRDFVSQLNFVDPARRLTPKDLPQELTLADFAFDLRRRCVEEDRDVFVIFDSGIGAEATGEGRTWTMILTAVLSDPSFDLRYDLVYGYDIGRYARITREINRGEAPKGAARMVDELDSMFQKREHSTGRQRRAMRNLHRNRKYNITQGGSGNWIFETDWYLRHARCTHRVEHLRRGVVRFWKGAVGEVDDDEKTFGHEWARGCFYVPSPDDCGLGDVYHGLYKACCRLTDTELPDEDEVEEMIRKHKDIPSPLDEALKEDHDWGLELIEDRQPPAKRIVDAVTRTLEEQDLPQLTPLTSLYSRSPRPRRIAEVVGP